MDKLYIDLEREIIGGITTASRFKEQMKKLKQEIEND